MQLTSSHWTWNGNRERQPYLSPTYTKEHRFPSFVKNSVPEQKYTNLPCIFGMVTAACTYEGENTVLMLQIARWVFFGFSTLTDFFCSRCLVKAYFLYQVLGESIFLFQVLGESIWTGSRRWTTSPLLFLSLPSPRPPPRPPPLLWPSRPNKKEECHLLPSCCFCWRWWLPKPRPSDLKQKLCNTLWTGGVRFACYISSSESLSVGEI